MACVVLLIILALSTVSRLEADMARVDLIMSIGSVLLLTFCKARAALFESACNSAERWLSGLVNGLSDVGLKGPLAEGVFNKELNQFRSQAPGAWPGMSAIIDGAGWAAGGGGIFI